MFTVYEKKSVEKQIKKTPGAILKRYEIWKRIVEFQGLAGLKRKRGYHDESLSGKWEGYRSSRLNDKWRVIYQINNHCCEIFVVELMPHKY